MNFDQSPMLVIWEVTQACDLACVHCRASAQSERSPGELTHRTGLPPAGRDPLVRRAPDGVHRRRSAEAARPVRPDPLLRQDRPAHQRDAQRHAAADARKPSTSSKQPASRAWRSAWTATTPPRTTISAASRAPSTAPCSRCATRATSGSIRSSRPRSRGAIWHTCRRSRISSTRCAPRCGACSS